MCWGIEEKLMEEFTGVGMAVSEYKMLMLQPIPVRSRFHVLAAQTIFLEPS
jgi:hypothetical protein